MKISFQNSPENTIEQAAGTHQANARAAGKAYGSVNAPKSFQGAYRIGGDSMDKMIAAGENSGFGGISSLSQLQQATGLVDSKVQQDYMTLMSNIMSDEDYAQLIREGYSPRDMTPDETVTIVDKIKAELAKAGKTVAGYNDDLDQETLAAALGSQTLAREVASSFSEADLPVTPDTVHGIREAWEMASGLTAPSDGAVQYLLRSGLEPQIANLYLAENSGAGTGNQNSAMYYASEVQGYYAQAGQMPEELLKDAGFRAQIEKVILQAGWEVNEESRESAAFLLEKQLPLTAENLTRYKELTNMSFPVGENIFADAVANAVLEGKEPKFGNLAKAEQDEESLYQKANRLMEQYEHDRGQLSDRRLLEEIRLHMTTEVNVKLLRSGFAIDTAPMEELVEALKEAEQQVAQSYFPAEEESVSKYRLYQETNQIVKELPGLPAQLLGGIRLEETLRSENPAQGENSFAPGEKATTLSETYRAGQEIRRELEAAREKYETLMTSPRADLGDSIRKAFSNVDTILEDLGYEISDENRKAVRVLGYNRMELTGENIDRIRAAQQVVGEVVEKMTPSSVLRMIRDGINPLEESLEALQVQLEEYEEDPASSAESYSRFLYRMEKSGGISETERQSYIGIYRMLHQIEKQDGAAIGMIVNTGAELQFANLLAAARSGRAGSVDVRLTDEEKAYTRFVKGDDAIDSQIEAAYRKELQEDVRRAANVGQEPADLLFKAEITPTVDHLLAAAGLLEDATSPYSKVKESMKRLEDTHAGERNNALLREMGGDHLRLAMLWESLEAPEQFQEDYEKGVDQLREQVQKDSLQMEAYLDVRELQLTAKQLSIMGNLAGAQEYFLPLEIDGEEGKLHLTLERDRRKKGSVSVDLDFRGGKTHAELTLRNGKVSGFLQGNGPQEVMKLSKAADILVTYLREETSWSMEAGLPVVDLAHTGESGITAVRSTAKAEQFTDGASQDDTSADQADLFRLAKLWIRAVTRKEVAYEN